jgi:GNAT superfamily N-acetyltransferase
VSVHVALLADHPEVLASLAAAYQREWPKWYGVHGDAMKDLTERSRHGGLPIGFVALEEQSPVGAVALADAPLAGVGPALPSVIGFWVDPARRRHGIGSRLLMAACEHARAQGIGRLYAATVVASAVFIREGWTMVDSADEPGVKTFIFSKTLAP